MAFQTLTGRETPAWFGLEAALAAGDSPEVGLQGACRNTRGFVPAGRNASGLPGPSPFVLELLRSVNDFLWLGVHWKGTVELPGGSTTCDTTADGGQKSLWGPGSLVLSQTLSLRGCVRPLSSVTILLRLVAKLGLKVPGQLTSCRGTNRHRPGALTSSGIHPDTSTDTGRAQN
nr:uncharacterized protein LOC116147421 isoform X1 [Camelus dromedarius]